MARPGIDLESVKLARESVISKGGNPTIDAVRAELGNTGSKTTIHRFLREIESQDTAVLSEQESIAEPILELVKQLSMQLQQQAEVQITRAERGFADQQHALVGKIDALVQSESHLNQLLAVKTEAFDDLTQQFQALSTDYESLKQQLVSINLEHGRLSVSLDEKKSQIQSLEEKHKHSREALEHYRASVKEQRDQDLRRHEAEVQHWQLEAKALSETISLQRLEISNLTNANTKLVAEKASLELQYKQAIEQHQNLAGELAAVRDRVVGLEKTNGDLADQLSKSQAELHSSHQRGERELNSARETVKRLEQELRQSEITIVELRTEKTTLESVMVKMLDKSQVEPIQDKNEHGSGSGIAE